MADFHSFDSRFQFTPLREGRRERDSEICYTLRISIHAPPRGATDYDELNIECEVFQFTPLREGRHNHRRRKRDVHGISIHAPPRGATGCGVRDGRGVRFQFTPLREGRRSS